MTRTQIRKGWRRAKSAFVSDSMVFFVVYLAVLGGIPIMLDPVTFAPISVISSFSEWMTRVWGFNLVLGGFLCGTGLLTERVRLERAGLACFVAGSIIYAVAISLYGGLAALLPVLTYIAFATVSIARYYRLGKVLQGIELARNGSNS